MRSINELCQKYKSLIASIATVNVLAACVTSETKEPRGLAYEIPFDSLVSDEFEDLRPLLPHIENKRIVQLGENSHGAREYSDMKARMIRFLHQEAGFDIVVFESSLYQCSRSNVAFPRPDVDTQVLLTGCAFGVWHTVEVKELFDYMRATRGTGNPLFLAGYDVQPIGWNKRGRPEFLKSVVAFLDPEYASDVEIQDQSNFDAYYEGSSYRRVFYRDNRAPLVAAYTDLQNWLELNQIALRRLVDDPADVDYAIQTVWSILQYIRQQTSQDNTDYAEARDYGMARNIQALVERLYPESRVIIWAHNAHIRHNNELLVPGEAEFIRARSAGAWLKDWYGAEIMTIGVYARSGMLVNNARKPFLITDVLKGSIETWQTKPGTVATLFIARQEHYPNWDEPVTGKYNGQQDVEMIARDQYDAIIVLDEVSPPEFLYE